MAKQLTNLKQYAEAITDVRRRLASNVKRGLASVDKRVQRICVDNARELVLELAGLTWDSTAMLMHQEQELHGPLTQQLPGWSLPEYFRHVGLNQWAKVRATPAGTFVFEAVTSQHQGVLLELPEFRLQELWHLSTATEYRAILTHLLDTGGIAWNLPVPQTLSAADGRSSVPLAQ